MMPSLWVVWSSGVIFPAAGEATQPESWWLSPDVCPVWSDPFLHQACSGFVLGWSELVKMRWAGLNPLGSCIGPGGAQVEFG